MQKRYTVKNPYEEFDVGEYYSQSQIDDIYDDISDTITVTDLNNAIAGFISGDDVHVKASAFTEDFQSETYIDNYVSALMVDYIHYNVINSRIDDATSDFVNYVNGDMRDQLNGFLVDYVTNSDVTLLIDSSITYLQEDYWHPEPIYERFLNVTVMQSMGSGDKQTIEFVLSGNTAWTIPDNSPAWVILDTYSGFGTTVITATSQSANTSHGPRTHTYTARANDMYPGEVDFDITQAAS